MFEKMLGYANHVGLYAEEIGHCGEALGKLSAGLHPFGFDQRGIQSRSCFGQGKLSVGGFRQQRELTFRNGGEGFNKGETIIMSESLDQLCINTIRMLSVDAVEKANQATQGRPWGWRRRLICYGRASSNIIRAIRHGPIATGLSCPPATPRC